MQAQSSVRLYGASWKPLGNHTAKPYCRYTESKRREESVPPRKTFSPQETSEGGREEDRNQGQTGGSRGRPEVLI